MNISFDGLGSLLLVPTAISLFLALEMRRARYREAGRLFSLLMVATAWWSLTYALELSSRDEATAFFWLRLEYLAIPAVPVLMYLLVRRCVGLEPPGRPWNTLLWVIPACTLLLQITFTKHSFFYAEARIDPTGETFRVHLEPGWWYFVHSAYSCGLGALAAFHLIRRFLQKNYSWQNPQWIALLSALILPYAVFTLYFFNHLPIKNLDPTPFAFSASGLIFALAIFRFQLLNIVPIAREQIFHSIGDPCIVLDGRDRLIDANHAALGFFQWEHLPHGNSWNSIPGLPDWIRQALRTSGPGWVRLNPPPSDESRSLLFRANSIKTSQGKIRGKLVMLQDDSPRMKMLEQIQTEKTRLAEANRQKDKLFAIIAHDLRSSFGEMAGIYNLMKAHQDGIDGEEWREYLSMFEGSVQSSNRLLENLLSWARLQRSDYQLKHTILPLKEILTELLQSFAIQIQAKRISTEINIPESMLVKGDRQMLAVLFRNLLSNAIKFNRENGDIRISASITKSDELRVEVTDSGVGIPPEWVDKLFQNPSITGRPGTAGEASTGMGLELCHEVVQAHQGQIEVESVVEQGTTFRIILPQT